MPGPTSTLLRQVSQRTKTLPERVTKAVAKVVERELKIQVQRDTGGDSRLSGMGNGRVSTKTEYAGTSVSVMTIKPAKRTTGMWSILESGADPHAIAARRYRPHKSAQTTRRKAMRVGDSWAQGPFRSPGTSGKRTWTTAIRRARPDVDRVAREELAKAVRGG